MATAKSSKALLGLLTLAYPVLVYLGLTRFEVKTVAIVVVAVAVPLALLRIREADRGDLLRALLPLAPAVVLGTAAAAAGEGRLLLWVPVLVNAALLLSFGSSLRAGSTPLVERIARLRDGDLPDKGVAHCRQVTIAWCVFFFLNGATAAVLALRGNYAQWALYNGGIAYALIGLMFAIELVIRRRRMQPEVPEGSR